MLVLAFPCQPQCVDRNISNSDLDTLYRVLPVALIPTVRACVAETSAKPHEPLDQKDGLFAAQSRLH